LKFQVPALLTLQDGGVVRDVEDLRRSAVKVTGPMLKAFSR
jgi:hypothetical protein